MRNFLLVAFALGSLFIAGSTAYWIAVHLWYPHRMWKKYDRKPLLKRWLYWGSLGASFIGVGFMIYKGIEGAFWFIPKSWVHVNDDGEREWIVHGLAFIAACYGAILFLGKLGDIASERVNGRS